MVDDSPVEAKEVDNIKMEGTERDKEEGVVFVKKKGAGGVGTNDHHRHRIGAAAGTERTKKTPTSPVEKTDSNKRMQVAQTPERMQRG